MKTRYHYLWMMFLLVSVITSCTMQKRLYQRGYHVEWNKRMRVSDNRETPVEQQISQQNLRLSENNPETIAEVSTLISKPETKAIAQPTDVKTSQIERLSTKQKTLFQPATSIGRQINNSESKIESQKSTSNMKSKSRKPATALRGLGFLGLGFLFFLASLLFLLVGGNLGTLLCVLSITAGIIFLIIGLVVLIKAAVTKGG